MTCKKNRNQPTVQILLLGTYHFNNLGLDAAHVLSAWYERNIRIFANLQNIVEPDDQVLLIFGTGHIPILRELIVASPNLELVDTLAYL